MLSLSTVRSRLVVGVAIIGLLFAAAGIPPALGQEAEEPTATEEEGGVVAEDATYEGAAEEGTGPAVGFEAEIVVTGFRYSLEQSVELKRDAVNVRDSIVVEDLAKMPDLNLAEAIQRVPGVAIVREGGEGRQMSLRGLGPEFTRVTLNGMEVPASTGGLDSSGGVNRGRSFDFNVFSAELFNRIDINKSAVASIEEGGVAGTVEMYTARPLDNPGFRGAATLQGGYNDLSESWDPRGTITVSTTNKAETIGFLFSGAYTERTSWQDGFGTVRWAQPDGGGFGGNETDLTDDELNSLWFPRLPRQDSFRHFQERLGLASSLEFRPVDDFRVSVNWVHSEFDATTESYNSFAQFRRSGSWGYPTITALDVTVAQDGTGLYALAGAFDNVALRTESRQTVDNTKFNQYTADFAWDINDELKLTGVIGLAESKFVQDYFRVNIETLEGAGFSYDFSGNADVAAINYDIDVTDPNNYQILDNENYLHPIVDRTNQTARVDLDWDIPGGKHYLKFGAIYNDRDVDSQDWRQNLDPVGSLTSVGRVFHFVDAGGYGSGTELDFLVLNFDRSKDAFGYGTFVLERGPGRTTWVVNEKTAGVYADYSLFTLIGSHSLRLNAGVRYVDTDTEATGWLSSDIKNTETNSYSNVLPSVNASLDLTKDLVLRAAVSRTMTRASLSSLAPIKTYSDVNFRVSGGNSQLDPLVSDNYDLGIEWYFAKQAVLGVVGFYKSIDSFISSPSTEGPLRPEDYAAVAAVYPEQPELLDPTLIWTYTTAANTDGTKLKGFEIVYQQTFTALPGFLKNFGFVGNYSYVDAETEVIRLDEPVTVPLEGLSKHSWNATLYYEVPKAGVRLSVNNRDDYVTNNTGSNGNISEATTGPVRYDMSAFYHITTDFSLTLEAVNLTDEAERLYTTGDGTMNLVREYNTAGRQFFLGARYNF
jgi:iron complex outermembrane receptor protein